MKHLYTATALLVVLVLLTAASAGERQAPEPSVAAVPVVADAHAAEAALEKARRGGRVLVADLTFGHSGLIVKAPSAERLAPGRYRLHALVASLPHGHILVDPVALKLSAGGASATFERRDTFRKPGELAPVGLDFTVKEQRPVSVEVSWFVGDTMLDRAKYKHRGEARRVFLAQRKDAINQLALKRKAPDALMPALPDDAGDALKELAAEERPRLRPRSMDSADLPKYRLLLTGLVIETLTPVSVSGVRTDQPAYAAGKTGQAEVTLRNWSAEPVTANIRWSVRDDDRPEEASAQYEERVKLTAGQVLEHTFKQRFETAGIPVTGRVDVRASVGELRPARGRIPFVVLPADRPRPATERRIFAHYMGCFPVGTGAPFHHRHDSQAHGLKHESRDPAWERGGHIRNWDLCPPDKKLTAEESADLEIRRALRIGLDGFAVDAWAGQDDARRSTAALFKVAAEKDYPFKITLCIDPACGGHIVRTVQWLLENYGDHPKLARRNGKPLIFGYFSKGPAWAYADRKLGAYSDAQKLAVRKLPLGWHLVGAAFRHAEQQIGQPIFYHFSYEWLFHPYKGIPNEQLLSAIDAISRHVDAVGSFNSTGRLGPKVAEVVKAAGAEWSGSIGMYHKENIPFEVYIPAGTEWMQWGWESLRAQGATIPQLITWNDYGENTNIAPAWNTRYSLYDLTGYHIAWWKSGKQPTVDHDRLYVIYAKYPRGAKVWPFAERASRKRKLEVLTILTEPATVRLPGRDITFEAPAGYSRKQFPLAVGPVIAELVREGEVVERIESPEPITDRPFRESNGMVCFSTEFMRHWKADFGETEPFLYGEYADKDKDGLPNWFEMYWFSKERGFKPAAPDLEKMLDGGEKHPVTRWLDFSTMTVVKPEADADGDGRTNLQEYLARTDPTLAAPPSGPKGGKPGGGGLDPGLMEDLR